MLKIWKGHNSASRASPDITPTPFDTEKSKVAISTRVRARSALSTNKMLKIWKGHNSASRASLDINPSPFDAEKFKVAISTRVQARNVLNTNQNVENLEGS